MLVSEEWDYVRAHLRVRRTERVVCTCADCLESTVPGQDPMPFERAACTFEMMAWVCFAKAGLFLPLDRLQRDFEDQGVHLASSTLPQGWDRGTGQTLLTGQPAIACSTPARCSRRGGPASGSLRSPPAT